MALVLDASMAVAWLFADELTPGRSDALDRVCESGAWVPSLWRLEMANVLGNAAKRGRCDAAYVDASLARLARLPISLDEETDRHAWGKTLELARSEGLTVYDAAYLELALRRALPLATCDTALIAACKRRALPVVGA